MKNKLILTFVFLLGLSIPTIRAQDSPNIIVILADDMGFSDLGCTGSEIATPHLDGLADDGLLFTHCYNTSRCCPSRASLLTGLYQHRAGVGHMNADRGDPAYRGHLNQQCVTIAEVLRDRGYRTIMTGKWHVGDERSQWPDRRGFDRFYGIPRGGGLYFYPSAFIDRTVYRNGTEVTPDSATFYSTDNFTDEALKFIREADRDKQPFFLYLAYIAPHYPLQAWPEDIARYRGRYDAGYDSIRQQRYRRQQALGVISPRAELSPADYLDWKTLSDPAAEARKMEVYAAQVDRMDQNIGKLLETLEELGNKDNTVIFFLSDNGACGENVNRSPDAELGSARSFVSYGEPWSNVGNTPYRLYKSMTHEGGITTPLIVHWPAGINRPQQLIHQPVHINDIMPTCLELAGAAYPREYQGRTILPLDGTSLAPILTGDRVTHNALFWEHQGNQAVRTDNLKLVRRHDQPWELYDLSTDPTELRDLSRSRADTARQLERQYRQWMEDNGVRPWPITQNPTPE